MLTCKFAYTNYPNVKFVTETVSSKLLILTKEGITWRNEVTIAKLLLSVTHHASDVSMEITSCLALWCDCSLHYGCSSTYSLHILSLMSSPGYTFFFPQNDTTSLPYSTRSLELTWKIFFRMFPMFFIYWEATIGMHHWYSS